MPGGSGSRSWRGAGWGMRGGSGPVAGMVFMVAGAPGMSGLVGMAGRPACRPSTLVLSCRAKLFLAWRSVRQKMSWARQITVTRAAVRRLFVKEQGGDGVRALDRGVAALGGFLAFAEDQDPGGAGLAGIEADEQGVPAVGGGLGIERILVGPPGQGGLARAGAACCCLRCCCWGPWSESAPTGCRTR